MDSGFYAALTALVAKSDALDLTANNFANISTAGYKAQHEFYHALEAAPSGPISPLTQAVDNYGVLGGSVIDLKPGSIKPTGNDLDVALGGSGFLVVKTQAGYRYTRNGNLQLSAKGELLSSSGDPIMGVIPGKKEPGPIYVPPGKITISPTGAISAGGVMAGQLKLVDFPHGTPLTMEGNSYFNAPAQTAIPAADPELHQGALESSNVNPMQGMVNLVMLQRQFEMMQKAVTTIDRDFNSTAITQLPNVQ
jgi:flagellar basal-body rod protein FlgF